MKRILSWVLALVMIISLLPAVTVLNVQAATTSLAVYLWDKTVTVDNDDTTADKLEAYYYLNNGTSAPTECTANDNWNYSYAIIDGIPTLTLRNAEYNFNSEPLIEKTSNSSFTLNIVYEGTNNITRTGGEVIKMPAGSMVYYPTINIIGKEGAVLNITGGGKSSHVVDFAAKAASADDGAKAKFIGGTVNITKGQLDSYSSNIHTAQVSLTIEDCNMTLTNQVTNTSMYHAALTVSGTYANERNLTVTDSDLTINTNGPLGILASGNKWGAYSLAKQNVTIQGDSNVSITVTDSVCTSDDYLRAGINANNLYLKDSATLEVKTSSAKIETIQAIVLNEGTAPDLSGYPGKYNMYTTEGGETVTEYAASSYFKIEPMVCDHAAAEKQTNCAVEVICPTCQGVAYPAKEHGETEVILGYAKTCTTPGLSDGLKCKDCGAVVKEQEEIPASHNPAGEASCTEDVMCLDCELVAIPATGHNFTGYDYDRDYFNWIDDVVEKAVKDAYGLSKEPTLDRYTWEVPESCTTPARDAYKHCKNCGLYSSWSGSIKSENWEDVSAYSTRGHLYIIDEGETGHKCVYCEDTAHNLTVVEGSGTETGHTVACSIKDYQKTACDYTEIVAHEFVDGVCACGFEEPAEEPEHTCVFDKEVVADMYLVSAATCTAKAAYYHSCECSKKGTTQFTVGEVDLTNHVNLQQEDEKPATCTDSGYKAYEHCDSCGYTTYEAIEALDHEFLESNYKYNEDATCQKDGTKTAKCTRCDEVDTKTAEGTQLRHTTATSKETERVDSDYNNTGYYIITSYCACGEVTGTERFDIPVKTGAVAKIGETKYGSLAAAIEAATEGQTITLIGTVELTGDDGVEFNKTLTLDLNGQTITSTGDAIVVTAGVLTIEGKGNVIAATDNAGSSCAVWAYGGKVIIMDGTYTTGGDTTTNDVDHQNDSIYTKNGGSVEIYGGTFKYTENVWTLNERDDNRGTIKVYGGEFEKFDPANNNSEGANTNFLGNQAQHTKAVEGVYTICDGKAQAAVEENKNPATYDAPGSYDLVVYCECDKELSRETNTIPQLTGAVAEVGGKKFGTLAAAIEAATEGQTVSLIADVEIDGSIKLNKNITLDLGAFDITRTNGGDTACAILVTANAAVITGTTGTVTANGPAVWAYNGNVTIEGGNYVGGNHAAYASMTSEIVINGGKFSVTDAECVDFVLNILDDYRESCSIKVYGGEFTDFDPANNKAEGANTNFLGNKAQHTKAVEGVYTICDGKAQAAVEENKKPATCTENGSYDLVVYCECSKELSRETKTIVSEGHDYTSDTTPATCTVDGKIVYTCTCGDSYEEPIIAQGHKFNVTLETVDPTVSAPGYVVYKCENCEETKTEEAGAQLSKPTLALNGSVVTITDADNIFVQLGVAFVGDKTVNVTKWNEFTALGGKALDGKNGYSNLGEAKTATLSDNGNYVFYVVYKNGEVNEMFYQLFTVTEANGAPSFAINGNKAELNANGNAIIQSGVKFVGTISDEAAAQITDWTHFAALTGKALDGKNGYTNLGLKSEATLTESGDYIFYVIYDDINGARRTVFFKMSANVVNDKPVIELDEGKAILNSNGREIIQSGVKFVEEISEEDFANIHEWGDFAALVGTALDNKKGYTNLGTKTEATLSKAGDYVYYVIYTDVAGNVKTMFTVVTVE